MGINTNIVFIMIFLSMNLLSSGESEEISAEEVNRLLQISFTKNQDKLMDLKRDRYKDENLINSIAENNEVSKILILHDIFVDIENAGFSINLDKSIKIPQWYSFVFVASLQKESLHLENLIPLIPPVSFLTTVEESRNYLLFASSFFGQIALSEQVKTKIFNFVHDVGQEDNGIDKLKNLVLFFLEAQILNYRKLATEKFKTQYGKGKDFKNKSAFMGFMREYLDDFTSNSSPALIAAKKLYAMNPDLFNDNALPYSSEGTYRRQMGEKIDLVRPTSSEMPQGFTRGGYNEEALEKDLSVQKVYRKAFFDAVKENKAQEVWRNYSWHILLGTGIIGLLFAGKKWQWYSKFQQFLEKYRKR